MSGVAIVSGAAGRFGRAFAARLARDGYRVFGADVDPAVTAIDGVDGIVANVGERADVERLVSTAGAAGPVRVLVNNAATSAPTPVDATWDQALADWKRIVGTNLKGTLLLSRAVVPLLGDRGHIVNVSTTDVLPARDGATNPPDADVFLASKWALNGLTDAWSKRLAGRGVRVNALCLDRTGGVSPDTAAELLMQVLAAGRSGENVPVWAGQTPALGPAPPPHRRITG